MKIALITDTHCGARNDLEVISNAQTKFYEDIFFPELDKRDIRCVIHLGDFFDRRRHINFKSLNIIKESFLEPLRTRNIDFHLIAGNHDVYHKNTNKLNSPELLIDEYVTHLYSLVPKEVTIDGLKIAMIPWINNENYESTMNFVDKTDATICMGHFEFSGFEMIRGIISDTGITPNNIFDKFFAVYSGHFHHKSTKGNITYLGSPFFLNWSDHGDSRGFHVFDTETMELEFVENTQPIYHKIKYDKVPSVTSEALRDCFVKVLVHDKGNHQKFEQYVTSIIDQSPHDLQIVDLQSETALATDEQVLEMSKDTMTVIRETIAELEIEDTLKQPLNKMMSEMYLEAVNEL